MSDIKTGSCLVCGEPATFKCSRRSREGGIDHFYCSKEHQTLVWPAHKLVCGSRAHPFRLPAFTQAEADSILQWMQTLPSSAWQLEVHSRFYQDCWRAGAVTTQESLTDEHIQRLVGHGGPLNPPQGSFDAQVLLMRKHNFDYHTSRDPDSPHSLGGSTLGSFASIYIGMTGHQNPPTEAQWYSEFCHRFLNFHELLQSVGRPGQHTLDIPGKPEEHMELINKCQTAAIRLVQQRAEPAFAAQIQKCFVF